MKLTNVTVQRPRIPSDVSHTHKSLVNLMSDGKNNSAIPFMRKVANVLKHPPENIIARKFQTSTSKLVTKGKIPAYEKFNFTFNYKGARVEVKQNDSSWVKTIVSDKLSGDCHLPEIVIEREKLELIARALDLKHQHDLSPTKPLFTQDGLINLQKAYLEEVILRDWCLTKTDLKDAYLHLADLRNVNFTDSVLDGACLQDTAMDNAMLKGVSMIATNLSRSSLHQACLDNAKLTSADLHKAKLKYASLKDTILTKANLYKARLKHTSLNNAILVEADLYKADLRHTDLSNADLQKANLRGANMIMAELVGANFKGADLCYASLAGANLENADLSETKLKGVNWTGANFKGVDLTNVPLMLPENIKWSLDNLDLFLNPDDSDKSLLTSIQSIDSCFDNKKTELARQLKSSLEQQGYSPDKLSIVAEPMLSMLTAPPFNQDKVLSTWSENILEGILNEFNKTPLLIELPEKWVDLSINIFISTPSKMLSLNALFNQLTNYIMQNGNEKNKHAIVDLYNRYLNHPNIKEWANFAVDGVTTPTENLDLTNEREPLILLPSGTHALRNESIPLVMAIARNDFNNMLQGKTDSWLNYFIYTKPCEQESMSSGNIDPEKLFKEHFPIFLIPFYSNINKQLHVKLLHLLFPENPELHELFKEATKSRSNPKEIAGELLNKVNSNLLQFLNSDQDWGGLTHDHVNNLLEAYQIKREETTAAAHTMLTLAAIFTRYSSNGIFGKEYESPEILRRYASGLMHEAVKIDNNILPEHTKLDWFNRLSGKQNAFTCAAVLANDMNSFLKTHCNEIRSKITPLAWL